MQNNEIYRAHWEQSKWLVLSSFFFIIPALYAYFHSLYFYANVLWFTSLISANYWRKATYSLRRNIDLFVAKVSFAIFAIDGLLYVKKIYYVIPLYSGFIAMTYFYYLSSKQMEENKTDFVNYHFLFHCFLTLEQFIIIKNTIDYTNSSK